PPLASCSTSSSSLLVLRRTCLALDIRASPFFTWQKSGLSAPLSLTAFCPVFLPPCCWPPPPEPPPPEPPPPFPANASTPNRRSRSRSNSSWISGSNPAHRRISMRGPYLAYDSILARFAAVVACGFFCGALALPLPD